MLFYHTSEKKYNHLGLFKYTQNLYLSWYQKCIGFQVIDY